MATTDDAPDLFNVLFLCTGNSARSVIAEAILERLGRGRFDAFSAGSHPRGEINPHALDVLRLKRHVVDDLRSKSWNEFTGPDAPTMHFVFTVCDSAAAETCPVWPGQPMTSHWGLPDPAALEERAASQAEIAQAFADTYRMLHHRIEAFVNLPLASLDKLRLQQTLDAIGASDA